MFYIVAYAKKWIEHCRLDVFIRMSIERIHSANFVILSRIMSCASAERDFRLYWKSIAVNKAG